jgi:hypothetical protein
MMEDVTATRSFRAFVRGARVGSKPTVNRRRTGGQYLLVN